MQYFIVNNEVTINLKAKKNQNENETKLNITTWVQNSFIFKFF